MRKKSAMKPLYSSLIFPVLTSYSTRVKVKTLTLIQQLMHRPCEDWPHAKLQSKIQHILNSWLYNNYSSSTASLVKEVSD